MNRQLAVRVFALPAKSITITIYMQRIVQACCCVLNISGCNKIASDFAEMVLHVTLQIHIDQFVFSISQVPVFNMLYLLINDYSGYDKYNGCTKLCYYKTFADKNNAGRTFHLYTF